MTLAFFGLTSYIHKQSTEIRNDFKSYYDQFKVDGSFVLYDQNNDKFTFYNQAQFKRGLFFMIFKIILKNGGLGNKLSFCYP